MERAKNDVSPRSPHTQIPCFHARGKTKNVYEKTISIVDIAEVRKTHIQYKTLLEWFGRQEGGMAGKVSPTAQKTKKMKSRTHFP